MPYIIKVCVMNVLKVLFMCIMFLERITYRYELLEHIISFIAQNIYIVYGDENDTQPCEHYVAL